nr:FAD binding domain-containing protein [Colletotrichum truncatum]KAF6792746.1 FAD binding domain-containing protein [Colletotrichum truncatum]
MNTTTYNKTNGIASIQPGSNWEMVFSSLAHHGVTAVGGRASVVGVGGFVTGGGYSFHTNSHGFACDSVANFEVVLANGTITNANAKDNADLWKALKGSSGNLGFVTRIDQFNLNLDVVNSTDMWGGLVRYNLSQRDNVFNAYIDFADNMAKDLASQNIVAMSWGSQGYGHSAILSNIDAKEAPPAFDKYMAIPTSSSTLRLGAVAEIVPEFTGPTPLGLYANWIVGQFRNDFRMMDFIDKKLQQYGTMMEEAAPKAKFDVLVQLQPFTQSMVAHGLRKGGNVLGLEHVVADGPTTNWLIVLTTDTLETQKKILPLALQYRKDINAHAKKLGVYKEWTYLNYAWADQDPIATYGDDNIAFLKLVAMKVDPDGVFQKRRKTGFKLPV